MTTVTSLSPRPWLDIWVHPRATVRGLLGRSPLYIELLLVAGSGVVQSMVQATSTHVGARAPGSLILPMTLVIGAVWGLLQLHLVATLLFFVGRWTGVPAVFPSLRTALSWAAIPQVAVLPFWVVATLVFGRFLYMDPELVMGPMPLAVLAQVLLSLATLVAAGWWIVLQVVGVAEVQHVSAWRALGNFLVAGLMFGVGVVAVVVLTIVARR